MVNYGEIWKKNINAFKTTIESQLEVKLDSIKVRPLFSYGFFEFSPFPDSNPWETIIHFYEDCRDYIEIGFQDMRFLGKAGDNGVYYPRAKFTKNETTETSKFSLLHELYHVGIARYLNVSLFSEEYENYDLEFLSEAYCEYMALKTSKELGFKPANLAYELEARWLEFECSKRKLEDPKAILDYFINLDVYEVLVSLISFEKEF